MNDKHARDYSKEQLVRMKEEAAKQLEIYASMGLALDMSRGKPSQKQLDLSNPLLTCLSEEAYRSRDGVDCRNYGGLEGLPEMKEIFADILRVSTDEIIVGGNASLTMMFDNIASHMLSGAKDSAPWSTQGKIKFLCPSPGYDRHFAICEYFGIEMITIRQTVDGPDMDTVEELVANDPSIKGIWCVPRYSNPEGIIYSNEVVLRLANMKTAAADFRIYWDNAYGIHHFYGSYNQMPNILTECEKAGHGDRVYMFFSFSKISFGGASVACVASSKSNIEYNKKRMSVQSIGPDKINQLRHVHFFKNVTSIRDHMAKHAALLRPKFQLVVERLEAELGSLGIAKWNDPQGGYFISFYGSKGTAKRIVALCKEAGLTMTPAGATYPYGVDPDDSHIRIAPSYPEQDELSRALDVFCAAVKVASFEAMM